jgi:hypothetical protein
MLQRFQMLVFPDPVPWKNVDRAPSLMSLNRAYGVFEALADMVPQHWGASSSKPIKFPFFVFDGEAQAVFNEWYAELHRSRLPAEENPSPALTLEATEPGASAARQRGISAALASVSPPCGICVSAISIR